MMTRKEWLALLEVVKTTSGFRVAGARRVGGHRPCKWEMLVIDSVTGFPQVIRDAAHFEEVRAELEEVRKGPF